jgi:hypothetical protein
MHMQDEWKMGTARLEAKWNSETSSLLASLEQKYKY